MVQWLFIVLDLAEDKLIVRALDPTWLPAALYFWSFTWWLDMCGVTPSIWSLSRKLRRDDCNVVIIVSHNRHPLLEMFPLLHKFCPLLLLYSVWHKDLLKSNLLYSLFQLTYTHWVLSHALSHTHAHTRYLLDCSSRVISSRGDQVVISICVISWTSGSAAQQIWASVSAWRRAAVRSVHWIVVQFQVILHFLWKQAKNLKLMRRIYLRMDGNVLW